MSLALGRRLAGALTGGKVLRNMFTVAGATATSQLIGLAALLLLSRRFDPESFGLFGLFFNLTTTVSTVATLGLHEAILAPTKTQEARQLLGVSILSATGMSVVVACLCGVLIRYGLLGFDALPLWSAVLIAPAVWMIALAMILQIWLIRIRRFDILSKATLSLGVARAGAQIVAGVFAAFFGWIGLLSGELAGRSTCVFMMAQKRRTEIAYSVKLALNSGFRIIHQYRSFVLFRTPSHFANNLSSALPLFLLSRSFDATEIGAFSFMVGVVIGPIGLVLRGVGDVFLGEFSNRFRNDRAAARRILIQTVLALSGVALVSALVVTFFGPTLFAVVFGEKWRLSGTLAQAYTPLLAAQLIVAPVGGVLFVCNRPGGKLAVDLTSISLQVVAAVAARLLEQGLVASTAIICAAATSSYILYAVLIALAVRDPKEF